MNTEIRETLNHLRYLLGEAHSHAQKLQDLLSREGFTSEDLDELEQTAYEAKEMAADLDL